MFSPFYVWCNVDLLSYSTVSFFIIMLSYYIIGLSYHSEVEFNNKSDFFLLPIILKQTSTYVYSVNPLLSGYYILYF